MTETVFGDYDQETLDALLDVGRRVPEHAEHTDRFEARSAEFRRTATCRLDLQYGPHPRERLDVFLPTDTTGPVPVNLFFHGGYWRGGVKERYSYVAEPLTAAGAACVVVEYALVPSVDLDTLIAQCRAAIAYVVREHAMLGLDPTRIHVSGHSAGGQIVGMLLAGGWQPSFGLPVDVVRGGCGVSGLYDMEPIRCSYLNATLGLDRDEASRNSPYRLSPASAAPLILAVGSLEGDEFLRQTSVMAEAWRDDVVATQMVMEGDDHYTAVRALGDPSSALTRAVLAQMGMRRT